MDPVRKETFELAMKLEENIRKYEDHDILLPLAQDFFDTMLSEEQIMCCVTPYLLDDKLQYIDTINKRVLLEKRHNKIIKGLREKEYVKTNLFLLCGDRACFLFEKKISDTEYYYGYYDRNDDMVRYFELFNHKVHAGMKIDDCTVYEE